MGMIVKTSRIIINKNNKYLSVHYVRVPFFMREYVLQRIPCIDPENFRIYFTDSDMCVEGKRTSMIWRNKSLYVRIPRAFADKFSSKEPYVDLEKMEIVFK